MGKSLEEYAKGYVTEAVASVEAPYLVEGLRDLVEVFARARRDGSTIFFFGNGGSASTGSHLANDLAKLTITPGQPRFRCLSLSDPVPTLLAWANDLSYAEVYAEQLKNLARPGDVAVGISGSGNSPNVLRGLEEARKLGMVTVGLIGMGGGKQRALCDHAVVVPSQNMQHIEDTHLVLGHLVCSYFRDERRG
jgi:D-sedoheptulose 7-phosphate isomerase